MWTTHEMMAVYFHIHVQAMKLNEMSNMLEVSNLMKHSNLSSLGELFSHLWWKHTSSVSRLSNNSSTFPWRLTARCSWREWLIHIGNWREHLLKNDYHSCLPLCPLWKFQLLLNFSRMQVRLKWSLEILY